MTFDMTRLKNERNILYVHIIWWWRVFCFFEHKLGKSCWMRRNHTKAPCHTRNFGTITEKKFNYSGGTENIDYLKIDGAQRAGYSKKNVVVLSACVVRPESFGLCRDI